MSDVTDATFEQAVIERSKEIPVVVDLWAEWCGPCKTLGPILEKVVAATGGKIELAKVDIDANPQVARAFQVQSIPAVYAFRDGQPVDGFVGAQPEHIVERFIESLLPSKEETEVERLVNAGDEESLQQALAIEPDNHDAIVGLAEIYAVDGRTDDALALVARIPETADTRRVAALARIGIPESDGEIQQRLEGLLDRVKTDEAARQEFVDLLELLGPDDPTTVDWRRKLTMRLF
jgi:putative thioredoxin